jgi:hypothetical protein
VAVSRSRYVLCRPSDAPIELNIYESQDLGGIFITYWIRVFQHFEELSSFSGLTFYVVWNYSLVRDLPSYGDDVVAILLTDEERIIPHYLRKVRFVFKAYGFRPWCGAVLWGQPPVAIAKCVREWMTWASHLVSFLRESGLSVSPDGGLVVPLGYAQQTDEPGKDFETRRYTVGFLGSVENKERVPLSLHALLGTPKLIARTRMIEGLQRLTAADPERVFFGTTGSFTDSIKTGGERYSEIMADTKIALAPRGSSVETYRFFEAMRQGCVVICDRLPPHWFYQGCPAIQIDDWSNLEAEVKALSADPERLLDLHRRSLTWWDTKLSERAVAEVVAARLNRRAPPRARGASVPKASS